MNHKTLTQISLIFLVFFLVGFFYFKYFYEENKNQKVKNIENKIKSSSSTDDNIVREILYEKLDNKTGNKYSIIADYGQFDDKEKKIILMSNVTAKMTFKNGTVANLKSNKARYNTISGNTNFMDNVTVNYLIHQILEKVLSQQEVRGYNSPNHEVQGTFHRIQLNKLYKFLLMIYFPCHCPTQQLYSPWKPNF